MTWLFRYSAIFSFISSTPLTRLGLLSEETMVIGPLGYGKKAEVSLDSLSGKYIDLILILARVIMIYALL